MVYESSSFVQYKAVNEAFADAVARIWKEGDVSEYPFRNQKNSRDGIPVDITLQFGSTTTICYSSHRCYVPVFLEQLSPSSFMLPFQVRRFSDVWQVRTIESFLVDYFKLSRIARESLLRGMLGADLIGFQTHSYARHFRQTVSRILSLEATPKGIQVLGSGGLNEGRIQVNSVEDVTRPVSANKVEATTFPIRRRS